MWRTTDSVTGDGFLAGDEAFFGSGDLERTFLGGEEALLGGGGGEQPLLLFGLLL